MKTILRENLIVALKLALQHQLIADKSVGIEESAFAAGLRLTLIALENGEQVLIKE